MGTSRRLFAVKRGRAILPEGAWLGLAFYAGLFVLSLLWNAGFSVMGVSKSEVARLVLSSFWPWVLLAQAKILLCYLAVGYVVGISAELVAQNLFMKLRYARVWWIIAVNAYFFLASVRKYPQLYTEALYNRGGLLKFFQLAVTDWAPDFLFTGTGAVLLSFLAFSLAIYIAKKLSTRIYIAAIAAAVIASTAAYSLVKKNAPARNTGPNILVIAADSLRSDRLGASGYARKITPNIDKIAAEGTVFNKAYTSFTRTFPAAISLLTGRLPVTHNVRHMFPDKHLRDHADGSLVEALRKDGYATAIVSDFAGDVFSRMRIGFEKVNAPYFNFVTLIDQRCIESHFLLMPYAANRFGRLVFPELKEFANFADPFLLADEAIDALSGLTRKDKFFCMVFFSNVHFPYAAPYPYYRKYAVPSYGGRYKYDKPPTLYSQETVTDRDIDQIRGLYDGSVEAFDAAAGKIIDYLDKKGCLDNTIVVVTADHGENLYENGWYIGHGEHLRGNNVLNIPLVISFPGKQYEKQVDSLVRITDIAPTLFEYTGHTVPKGMDGVSLMPLIRGAKRDLGLLAFAETGVWFSDVSGGFFQEQRIMYPDITGISAIDFTYNMEVVLKKSFEALVNTAKHRMVDDGRYRLIYIPTRQGIRYELYDGSKDITGQNPKKAAELKTRLFGFMQKDKNIVFKNGFAVPSN